MATRPAAQPGGAEPRGPRTLEECLKSLEPLSIARGQLVATDGVCDVRVSIERERLEVELIGHELPKGLHGEAAVIRAIADTAFWDAPLYDVNAGMPFALPDNPSQPRPRLHVAKPDAPREICRAVAEELSRLEPVRRRVPSLAVSAQATQAAKNGQGGSPMAQRLRGTLVAAGGEVLLYDWIRKEELSFVEVACALVELLDANEAKVVRKQDPASSAARCEAALKGGGFCPGLRAEKAARSFLGRDPVRAVDAFCRSGHRRLEHGRIQEGLDCFATAASQDRPSLPDQGIAALEGLLIALEADAKDPRRPQGADGRMQEAERVAFDLGRAYFSFGLMNRARAALERAVDDQAPAPFQLELVEALHGAGQLGRALDRAEALAPKLSRAQRRALACKLAEGAKGPSLERALALAGLRGQRRIANVTAVSAVVFLAVGSGFGLQAAAASSLASAGDEARASLEREGPTRDVAERYQTVANRWFLVPARSQGRLYGQQLQDLAADAEWLKGHRAALAWRGSADPDAARSQLRALSDGAKTDALKARVQEVVAALDAEAKQCRREIDLFRAAVNTNDFVAALEGGRKLIEHYPTWKNQWQDLRTPVRIQLERPEDAIIEWDGERVTTTPPVGYLTLEPGTANLSVHGETGSGWKPYVRKVELATVEKSAVISVTLERDPKAGPIKPPTPTGTNPQPTNGTHTDTSPQPRRGKITIGGDTGPPPDTTDPGDTNATQADRKNRFEVREVVGSDIQKILGGGPIDVQVSGGYFDYLLKEVPGDGRLRLSVDVITRVRDHKVFLDGIRLRLEDTVLGHAIAPRDVDPDEPAERPLQGTTNGRRAVLPLDRCVGLDQAKFKAQVRDGLVQMVRDFNKREGQ